jgi:cytochrome c-type biogenesis protein CcmF
MEATMAISRGGSAPRIMRPQARYFSNPPTPTTESAQLTAWDGQLYLVLGDELDDGRWQLRLWWKPFVTLIWAGGAMIALGGVLALVGRLGRGWLRGRARARNADAEALA